MFCVKLVIKHEPNYIVLESHCKVYSSCCR